MKKTAGYHVRLWLPAFAWCCLIFYFSGRQSMDTGLETTADAVLKKTAHIIEYGILCLLVRRGFKGTVTESAPSVNLFAGVFSLLYAVSDELHQSFIPSRNCRVTDVLIDMLGVILALYVIEKVKSKNYNK